jgi:ABC-type multidrug transport system fused ATPase/permease subunit
VSFEQVCFRYPSRPETAVLEDFSLMLKAGERVALVGASGAGKSTVAALLLRLYEPQRGRILVDGIPASQYALAALRQQMAVVPQEVLLFSGTIAENIGYGRPGAPEAAILDAARKANAHDFIIQLPKGYETEVGDRGIKLSGGQRQRVAIARAILRDPAILILDEATSALDAESENLIQSALDSLMERRTTLIIAHRFSTVAKADTVAVLEGGRVVERGTPAQLLQQQSGAYRRFSRLQFELAPG